MSLVLISFNMTVSSLMVNQSFIPSPYKPLLWSSYVLHGPQLRTSARYVVNFHLMFLTELHYNHCSILRTEIKKKSEIKIILYILNESLPSQQYFIYEAAQERKIISILINFIWLDSLI